MKSCGVTIPPEFAAALEAGRAADVRDAAAPTPEALLGRALARTALGEEEKARADLIAALPALGDAARVELAMLDIRQRLDIPAALDAARAILARAPAEPTLAARAHHVVGLAEGKLRRTPDALDALLSAARLYGEAGDRRARSQVHDGVGMLLAARGRLDQAVYWYALSLADKALLGDRLGMAITLGNLGRLHLRAGRNEDALECFTRDLELAVELEDLRGQARMHEDIGRAHAAAEEHDAAAASYERAIELAAAHGYRDLSFFAWRDLAVLRIQRGELDRAAEALAQAAQAAPPGGEPYFELLLAAAEGELMLARGDEGAVARLEETADGLAAFDLPDLEIPCRMLLARALHDAANDAHAEHCLMRALARARRDGYARYLAPINEALSALGLVEGTLDEESRPTSEGADGAADAYVLRAKLGAGAFGEVYRAYDPERHREVAFKRIFLDRVYDPARRKQLTTSARLELDAASRVRHPGVVRVFAVGTEKGGGMYVVQEFVEGRDLRDVMDEAQPPELESTIATISEIAFALQALHDGGVVHRDLKPENVLVRRDGTPVLVDFGIAHLTANEQPDDEGFIVGTMHYMAPEQMRGQVVDHRADLYALGAMAYEWLAGRLPIVPQGTSVIEEFRSMFTGTAVPLEELRPELPDALHSLVGSLLERDPQRRPQDAAEAAQMFAAIAVGR